MSSDGSKALTLRVSAEEYDLLKTYAFFTRTSMNDVITRAVRGFLAEHATDPDLDDMVDRAKEKFRATVERLNER